MRTMLLMYLVCLPGLTFAQDTVFARKIIKSLCSKDMAGRGYYKNGANRAAVFIANEFKRGIIKAGGGVQFQKFQFPVNVIYKSEIKVYSGHHWTTMKPGADFIVNPDAVSGNVETELSNSQFLNRNILSDSQKFKDFFESMLNSGNAWVVIDTLPQNTTRDYAVRLKQLHEKFHCIELYSQKSTWSVAHEHVEYYNISVDSRFRKVFISGCKFKLSVRSKVEITTQKNIISFIPGSERPDSVMMITAHYDHLGQMGPKAIFRGANDNAAGIAMMLDLAKYYENHKPRYTTVFMAFAGEEAGLIGSYFYNQNPFYDANKIRVVLNLDLVGTGETGMTVVNATVFPGDFQMLDSLNKSSQLLPEIRKRGKAANSDHYFFSEQGIHAFFWYQSGPRTSYHDVFDIPETLSLAGYEGTVKLAIKWFSAMGN